MSSSPGAVAPGHLPAMSLILGGARSGKSRLAERWVEEAGGGIYLATSEPGDAEMRARIAAHRARRGPTWTTIEAPLDISAVLRGHATQPVLVDCLTLWLSNLMHHDRPVEPATEDLIEAAGNRAAPLVLVSNEVGLGIVPDNALARAFRDAAGRMHQRLAEVADRVVFVAAGLPLFLKSV